MVSSKVFSCSSNLIGWWQGALFNGELHALAFKFARGDNYKDISRSQGTRHSTALFFYDAAGG